MTDGAQRPLPAAETRPSSPGDEFTEQLLGAIGHALIVRLPDRELVVWNAAAEELLGWRAPDVLGSTLTDLNLAPLDELGDETRTAEAGEAPRIEREMLLRCEDGHFVSVLAQATAAPSSTQGGVVYVLWDLTQRLQAEQQGRPAADQMELLQYSADLVALVDPQGIVTFVNSPMVHDGGYSTDELVGHCAFEFVHPDDQEQVMAGFAGLVADDLPSCPMAFRFRTPAGDLFWLEGRAINLLHQPGVRAVLMALHDVTHRVEVETVLAHRATHDALTDLPNRVLLLDRLNQLLQHGRRHEQLVAVFYWDVDEFKNVNDRAGHAVGDSLLVEIARRATAAMRSEDTVARVGGDEFAACAAVSTQAQVCALAERLLESLVIDVTLAGGEHVQVTASIGVAFGTDVEAERLLAEADAAMYDAKRSGGRAITVLSVATGGGDTPTEPLMAANGS